MKWAIVFYAILAPLGGTDTEEIISWGLTFKHHEECIQFYNKNRLNKNKLNNLSCKSY